MKTLNELKKNIKGIAESVRGIGKVYDRYLYAFDTKQVKDFFSNDSSVNALMFREAERISDGGEGILNEFEVKRLWQFRFIYGYSYENNSEDNFDNICEELCKTYNSENFINSISRCSFLNIVKKYDSEYHGILVHNAEMEMETN
jgi:hypothetical protein